jgi:hypothetical protein
MVGIEASFVSAGETFGNGTAIACLNSPTVHRKDFQRPH